jgi:hypothetical protein
MSKEKSTEVKTLLQYDDDGSSVIVEVDDQEPGFVRASAADQVARAATTLYEALAVIQPTARALLARIEGLPRRPAEATVEFGIRLNGKVGAVVASTEAEGHFRVRLTWQADARTEDGHAGIAELSADVRTLDGWCVTGHHSSYGADRRRTRPMAVAGAAVAGRPAGRFRVPRR